MTAEQRAGNLRELATGRLYIDGEPEVRIREKGVRPEQVNTLLLVVTKMGDEDGPVGLTSSLFFPGESKLDDLVPEAKQHVADRVAQVGGVVLQQEIELLNGLPDDITRFVVINLLRHAKQLLPQ
jgi:hypothetical protein